MTSKEFKKGQRIAARRLAKMIIAEEAYNTAEKRRIKLQKQLLESERPLPVIRGLSAQHYLNVCAQARA